jgi:thiol-disulfide isomerase/thioredoxin
VQDITIKGWTGWEVVAADGTILRRFADTNSDNKIDLWAYYNFGIEVYRDIDADFDGKADEHRWLGTGGTKWGLDDDENGSIDRWKRISAEEVSAELVKAVAGGNAKDFARLLISNSEVQSLGLGSNRAREITAKASRAARDFADLANRQTAVGSNATWVQFAAPPPGIVPAGTDGSTRDLLVYENVVAMFEQDGKSGQLMVGTLVKVGESWRMVDLPSIGANEEAVAQSSGIFFTPGGSSLAASKGGGGESLDLVVELEKIDAKLASTSDEKQIAALHQARADLVEQLIKAAPTQSERETWIRQLVDTVSVAVQSGSYPQGVARLRKVAPTFARGNDALAAYADFQAIGTEYVARQTPDAKFEKVQEWYLEALEGFIDRYPKTPEAAQATLQLALSKEFEDKESDALRYYRQVASAFPQTDAGEKAAGAVRRLESVGKRIDLKGRTIDNQPFSLADLRGRPVVIHYWATWCEPCKQDMKQLRRLQARYKDLQLVGVNVDTTRNLAAEYLRQNSLPWSQLFDEGGLESSPLAKAFGVQTLPTMMLVDQAGKVVRHNVRADELDSELEKLQK